MCVKRSSDVCCGEGVLWGGRECVVRCIMVSRPHHRVVDGTLTH